MDVIFTVFAVGLAVTLVIVKGLIQASDFATKELEKQDRIERKKNRD
jgi:hypothetical protein